jgi:diamine N-acetyltransferase
MPKRTLPSFEDDCITLRLLEAADLPLTRSWRNQDYIRKWFVNSNVISEDQHSAWFQGYMELDNDFVFVILAKDLDNTPVGQISLYGIDWHAQTAEYGRLMIGNLAAHGKGYAKRATRLILKIGFNELHLHEIFLEVFENNVIAQKLYKDCGFHEQGKVGNLMMMNIKQE